MTIARGASSLGLGATSRFSMEIVLPYGSRYAVLVSCWVTVFVEGVMVVLVVDVKKIELRKAAGVTVAVVVPMKRRHMSIHGSSCAAYECIGLTVFRYSGGLRDSSGRLGLCKCHRNELETTEKCENAIQFVTRVYSGETTY